MTDQPTTCPTGCGRNANPGQLLCPPCWREVPAALQRDVYATWRRYRRFTGIAQSPERRAARIAYQQARDAAIGSIA